jgi:MYXO-CTERM domain-containing protein
VPAFSVTGTVRDAGSAQPLSGVFLRLEEGRETATAGDGTYAFRQVPAGAYSLTAEVEGYLDFTQQIAVTDADQVVDVALQKSGGGCGCAAGGAADGGAGLLGLGLLAMGLACGARRYRRPT